MRQVLIRRGKVITEDVPAPVVSPGAVLIRTAYSCISSGTELSSVQGSAKPLIQKALEQPEQVRKVLQMASAEGVTRTWEKVQGKLETPAATGYSLAGTVLAVGEGVHDLKPGDAVAAAGAGQANHAEFVDVPANLVVKLPEGLDFPSASTVALGAIALQGVRRLNPALGEFVVVIGAGIVGQLASQMLRLSGARVAAIDLDAARLAIAQRLGAEKTIQTGSEDAAQAIQQWTGARGADAVLFCASTHDPRALKQAFHMTRKKGRVVMVGVWGDQLDRSDIYEKEIDFLISTSYGPGRYDDHYEKAGSDYPYAYVRWTEHRNMAEYLRLLSEKKVDTLALIQNTFPVTEADRAFASLQESPNKPVIVLLKYPADGRPDSLIRVSSPKATAVSSKTLRVGIIGAGSFTSNVHLPNLKALKDKFKLHAVCNRTGHTAKSIAERYGASYATSDYKQLLADSDIDLVLIGTRHSSHGPLVLESLKAGKHVFVEKPLCLERSELRDIQAFFENANGRPLPLLMVGFNRRFSPYIEEIRKHTERRENPLFIHYRMNAGRIPLDHWAHGPEGGGRIRGEACHIIDLFSALTGAKVHRLHVESLTPKTPFFSARDNRAITLSYADGSVAVLEYFAVGSTDFPKEYMEVHFDQKTIVLDDYKSLRGLGVRIQSPSSKLQDKGHRSELEALYTALQGSGTWPIPLWELAQTTEATIQLEESEANPLA